MHILLPLATVASLLEECWRNMTHLDVSILEKMIRPIFIYFFLIVGLRLAGKRELAQLNPFDLIVLLMLSNTVQNAIIGNDNSVSGGVIGAATLLVLNYGVVRIVHRSRKLEHVFEGDPEVLIEHGKLVAGVCESELITLPELEAAARKEGIESLDEVEKAVLEPTGTISFIEKQPTPDTERHLELVELIKSLSDEIKSMKAAKGHNA